MSAVQPRAGEETIDDTLARWRREEDEGRHADGKHRAARQKLAAIRERVDHAVPALIDERRRITMRLDAIDAALRAERSILQRELDAIEAVGAVEPLEAWRADAAADAIRGALDAIRRVRP